MVEKIGGATWYGDLANGFGQFKLDSDQKEAKNAFSLQYDADLGTNPEAMLGSAQAGCYSLVLSMLLNNAGFKVDRIDTDALITVGTGSDGYGILGIKLVTKAMLTGISQEEFLKFTVKAKNTCLVCKALSAVEIELDAHLVTE